MKCLVGVTESYAAILTFPLFGDLPQKAVLSTVCQLHGYAMPLLVWSRASAMLRRSRLSVAPRFLWLAHCYFASHRTCHIATWVLPGLRSGQKVSRGTAG